MSLKARRFWPLLLVLVLSDCATKRLAQARLVPAHVPHRVAGDVVRLTLTYNRGAAFGIDAGPRGRWVLAALSLVVLLGLSVMYRRAEARDLQLVTALALLAGGAVGNLLDRVRSPRGVVDFIDLGIGDARFWTFNLADVGISIGAVLLALTVWRRGHPPASPIATRQ
ncbi:MAG: signal peptidase II [Gemmatimonadales bacterium]